MPAAKRGRPKKTKEETVKAMVIAGMTEREIAAATNLPKTTVHDAIHRAFTPEEIEQFKNEEVTALRAFRARYLEYIDQDAIKKMISTRGMTDYGIAFDKEMVATGKVGDGNRPLVLILKGSVELPEANVIDAKVDT